MPPKRWLQIVPVPTRRPSVLTRTTTPRVCRRDAPHRRDPARGPEHRPPRWFRQRWPHHPPQGLRQVDKRPPRDREGVCAPLDCVYGWIKQWGGLRQFKLRGSEKVSAVFGLHVARLQPDLAGQSAQTGDGSGVTMNRWLPRGVAMRPRANRPSGAKRLKSGAPTGAPTR